MEDTQIPKFIIIDPEDYFSDADINAGYVNYFSFDWDQTLSSREIALLEKIKKVRPKQAEPKV